MLNELKQELNMGVTHNGANTYKSTLNKCLDFFSLAGGKRSNPEEALKLFQDAFAEDGNLAVQILFYFRDVRGGQGERMIFRTCLLWLSSQTKTKVDIVSLLPHIVEHGRWDDLYTLVYGPFETEMFAFMKKQLDKDMNSEMPSLLAKWLKSENTSSKVSVILARKTIEAFKLKPRTYRKTLSALRAKINVLETLMSSGRWDEIDFTKLPAKAGLLYRKTFEKRQPVRYQEFLDMLESGKASAKSSTLYPYELVGKVGWGSSKSDEIYLNSAWDNLPNYLQGDKSNAIAVVDVSGSMKGDPMDVAVSLGLYLAERNKGTFANHFITFSSYPQLIEINEKLTFCEKVHNMKKADWGMNTDVEAVFNLILNTAVKNHTPAEDVPETLYIISDMQFDHCSIGLNATVSLMDAIKQKWEQEGYRLPRLVFWNVNASSNIVPMYKGNVALISGLSPSIFRSTIKNLDAMDTLLDAVQKYSNIIVLKS